MEIFQWIWPWEIFLVMWISSFRKINPSSLWFTNRGEWFRQNYGSVWIFHCWNGLFGVCKPHRKGKVPYSSCNLCHVLTIIISPQEKWWQRPCTAMNQMIILLVPDSLFSLQSWPKYVRQTLFFSSFLLVLTKCSIWEKDWALGYNSLMFWDLIDVS